MFKKALLPALAPSLFLVASASLAFAACLCLMAANAGASDKLPYPKLDEVKCFQRTYDEAHLAQHPGQIPADMTLALYRLAEYPDSDGVYVALGIHRASDVKKGVKDKLFWNGGTCWKKGSHYQCGFDCDGGQFELRVKSLGDLLLKNKFLSLYGCGEGEEQEEVRLDDDAENSLFRLPPSAPEACLDAFPYLRESLGQH